MVSITQGTRVFNRVHKEPSPVHVYKICEEAFMKQKNTDMKSIQDDFDDDLNIEFDEPLSYERFHRLLEHAKKISNQEKSDEQ